MIRQRIDLDGEWDFFPDPQQRLDAMALDAAGPPRRIRVPGPWQAQFDDLHDYSGVAWYRRTFDLRGDEGWGMGLRDEQTPTPNSHPPSSKYVMHFGAVDYHTTVWLNGQLLGEHEGGYLPFELALGDTARPGANELVVRVIDPDTDMTHFPGFPFEEIPHGKQSWYGPIGGIWQSVYVEARAATHLTGLKITPDVPNERAHVLISLNRPAERQVALRLTVTDPRGQASHHDATIDAGARTAEATLPIPNPLLWDTDHPHLYRLEASLNDQRDSISATFGMRSFAAAPDGNLLLNGRPIYLRSALDQDYYPDLIYTPFDDAAIEDQFAKAKHMGLNSLRTHIKITDPRYYDAADRAGLLIWTELPNWANLTAGAKRRARATLEGMIERDWNHPSIVIWTIINENWGTELAVNPDHRAWLAETYDYVKQLDPHRLVVDNSACTANAHVVSDIDDFHIYYSIPDHYQQWRSWVEIFAQRPPWTYAHDYGNFEAWRAFTRDHWNPRELPVAREVRRRGNEPLILSEFGNWGLPDMTKLRAGYGGRDPWWFETGHERSGSVVYPHAIDERFEAYHLNLVFQTLSDLTTASQRLQFLAMKYEIEQIRRHPSIVGYVITEFTDVHWECNGLLDMHRNPKSYYDIFAQVNADVVIVPEWKRTAYWEGERVELDLLVSNFGSADLGGSRLEWRLDRWPEVGGTFSGLSPRPTDTTHAGTVAFEVPRLEQSARARLELRLHDATGNIASRNEQELYFFPRRLAAPADAPPIYAPGLAEALAALGYRLTDDLASAGMAMAATMTDELRWYLQDGGRVLWLATSDDAQQTHLGVLGVAPREGRNWQGDWASNFNWLRQDRLFGDIPTDGLVDFAFADLTPDHVITGLRPRDYAADVHAGLCVGWLHDTVGLVAERRFGAGRLLTSTFRLREHVPGNPVATIMLNDMIRHLTGG
ncbi:MAG TPA: glycoside hydrolase family 2 TIM barrel-domain containing protein [Roseiflexaceae bacterium]|nr:glycoside hydrolase family 2 TIM barrel-domain containing protein [Roseiflexaceae bacterium]